MNENVLTFDLKPFEDLCGKLPATVERAAMRAAKAELGVVQYIARTAHRFQGTPGRRPSGRYYRNTGKLVDSIQVEMTGDGGRVYLDDGVGPHAAPYGPYVHEGQRSWQPDQFLYDSFSAQHDDIVTGIGEAVGIAISEL
jgi:hypothetical protein